jgi:hypothetical protein
LVEFAYIFLPGKIAPDKPGYLTDEKGMEMDKPQNAFI